MSNESTALAVEEFFKLRGDYSRLADKANTLARLVEQLAYAPVAGYYEQLGNKAPLQLLRLAVEDIDALTETVPCKTCNEATYNTDLKTCNGCWEVEHRLDAYLATGYMACAFVENALIRARATQGLDRRNKK